MQTGRTWNWGLMDETDFYNILYHGESSKDENNKLTKNDMELFKIVKQKIYKRMLKDGKSKTPSDLRLKEESYDTFKEVLNTSITT